MSGRNDNAFERQLDREIDRLAGPDPTFDVREVVEQASGSSTQRRWFGGNLFVPAALVVVLVFGALIVVSGVLTPSEEDALVGASPTPLTDATSEPQEVAASKVYYADGTFTEVTLDWERLDPLLESGDFPSLPEGQVDPESGEPDLLEPELFTVASSDPRLSGDAIVVSAGDMWEHTVTTDDIDDPLPAGLWSLASHYGRMEIRNADGAWQGPVGPAFVAQGEDPSDGTPGNAPSLAGRVPAVLSGSGAYAGLTAYLSLVDPSSSVEFDGGLIEDGPFEAVIVNRAPVGGVSDRDWTEAREWTEAVVDEGFAQ